MKSSFSGFARQMPTFFRELEHNNDREWFAPRKELFETHVRAPMIELVTVLIERLRKFAPEHVADIPHNFHRKSLFYKK